MAKIIDLVDYMPATTANRDCISMLEAMLELAQRGEIVALGLAAVHREGDGLWMLSDVDRPCRYLTLSGVIRRLERDIEATQVIYDGEGE